MQRANTSTVLRGFITVLACIGFTPHIQAEPKSCPNVLVIMTDDLGFSDVGCYGGEIETPHLDRLAADGLRFNQFYNTAKCHSSRVSLLTGQYCIAAGDTTLSYAVTSAEVLGNSGYFTAMTGKWHLKREPTDFGFDRYFGHLSGACNYFKGDKTFRLNGQPWQVPDSGFYTTVANVDFALQFLGDARASGKPWYLYVAFNAPHAPLHALPADYAKYRGRYDQGWDVVRAARVAKQKRLELLPADLKASPRPEHIPAWETMAPWRQAYEANRMSTLAAMIDCIDRQVGRLVEDLRSHNELDNTLILFVSDNGACPYDRRRPLLDVEPTDGDAFFGDSTGWAWARNGPFRYYKQNQFEGGIATPAIVHWPAGLRTSPGTIIRTPAHLIDVLPTLADICQSPIPDQWPGRDLRPVSGVSLAPLLRGQALSPRPPSHFLFSRDRALRDNDWKLVSFRGEAWELYHMAEDRAELNDLAQAEPERLRTMIETWTEMTRDVLRARPTAYAPVTEARLPHRHPEWTRFNSPGPIQDVGKQFKHSRRPPGAIRARKNTELTIIDRMLQLRFTGDDPGIAMDLRGRELPKGPYRLSFRLLGGTQDGGDVFYTVDPKTTLPKGKRVPFDVYNDGTWQQLALVLPTDSRIYQLRIDVGSGPGKAIIAELELTDKAGKRIVVWPEKGADK
ncbi:MAG: arylsulfatase [Planctomycetota bacterium]